MSILIRNMEMPKYCYDCPCHNGESGYCQIAHELSCIDRPAECPLENVDKEEETEFEISKRGKSNFVLLQCKNCGRKGWYSKYPNYCPECGKKVKMKEIE